LKRPKIITLICIIGYITTIFTFPQVFSPAIKKLGILMPALYGILVAGNFISCVGVWYYKRWGVQLYIVSAFARVFFFLLTAKELGFSFYFGSALYAFSIVFLLRHFPKMSTNL
jgi:hypothetical protein